ncbi:MAG: hypothetical protein Kow00109_27280 [Acidobacteriota bacterium]
MVHWAKVDRWMVVLLGGLGGVYFWLGFTWVVRRWGAEGDRASEDFWAGVALMVAGVFLSLMLWLCYRIRYELTPSELIIRFGPFKPRIPLDAIEEVLPSRSLWSAPAPSLLRLRINYRRPGGGRGFALISPRDRLAFVRDLRSLVPELQPCSDDPLYLRRGTADEYR